MEKGRGIGFGVFLLTLGIIWALVNLGVVDWSIMNAILVLWPLILVAIGLGIIFRRNWIARLVIWVGLVAVLIGYGYFYEGKSEVPFAEGSHTTGQSGLSVEKPSNLQKARLDLDLAACNIRVDSGAAQLVEASLSDKDIRCDTSFNSDSNSGSVRYYNTRKNSINLEDDYQNSFLLNPDAIWDISVDTGASDCKLDLSKLQVEKFEYDGGASKLEVTFSDKSSAKVNIDTGVSKVTIRIPQSVGIRVKTDNGLSSMHYNGSGWIKKESRYETDNYEQASCKIDIDANTGVSDLNIDRIQ